MSDDSRAALEAAWEEAEAEAEDISVEAEEEETEETTDEVVADVEETDEPEEVAEEPADETVVEASEDSEEEVEEPAETVEVKAPQSWRAAAREVWAEIPESARAEIEKREAEIANKLTEVDGRAKQAEAFEQAIEPFRQTIAIEANGDPIVATRNLMGIATRLRGGSQHEKAMVVRDIIQQYGVDIETLDSALAGVASVPVSSEVAPPPAADPRVDQLWNQQQAAVTSEQTRRQQEAQAFMADSKNEFANDVRDDMADLFQLASMRGETLSLKDAYDKAVALRPDLQRIVAGRSAAPDQTSLKRKKRAASSIKGSPSGSSSGNKQPADRRGMLSAAWDALAEQTQ